MTVETEVLARFHRALVDEIGARRPEYLSAPFTVAEIYQNLVPYASHRDRIGVEMNGDYEDALLRLLAGEGSYLVLDSEPALRALREELDASNPNTGVYREYAAVDVRLNPTRLGSGPTVAEAPKPSMPPAVPRATTAPVDSLPLLDDEPADDDEPETEEVEVSDVDAPDACRWCRAELPDRPGLNYCPFCGTDVHVIPCPGCGEELEAEWRFCVACGTEVTS